MWWGQGPRHLHYHHPRLQVAEQEGHHCRPHPQEPEAHLHPHLLLVSEVHHPHLHPQAAGEGLHPLHLHLVGSFAGLLPLLPQVFCPLDFHSIMC